MFCIVINKSSFKGGEASKTIFIDTGYNGWQGKHLYQQLSKNFYQDENTISTTPFSGNIMHDTFDYVIIDKFTPTYSNIDQGSLR